MGLTDTTVYKIDKSQRPIEYHRDLYSILCNNLKWKRNWKRIYTAESPCCTPKMNMTLSMKYTAIFLNPNVFAEIAMATHSSILAWKNPMDGRAE